MQRSKAYYQLEYVDRQRSIYDIAAEHGTYPNKIRRELQSYGLRLRDKSEAQRAAIKSGRHKHPTKGRERPLDVRLKISASMSEAWGRMSDEERDRRVALGKVNWQAMTEERRESFRKLAALAVREASENGSKLERFIRKGLGDNGYIVRARIKLGLADNHPVDIYLINQGIVIDIDGPFHFLPIWGDGALARQQKSDQEKAEAVLRNGLAMIRVIYMATMSTTQQEALLNYILEAVDNIRRDFPDRGNRLIEIEVK